MKSVKRSDKMKVKNKLVAGWGINDADYKVRIKEWIEQEDGTLKQKTVWMCPIYSSWSNFVDRSYSKRSYLQTYMDCSVDERWKRLSDFTPWYNSNYIKGWDLDKDLLVPGNKVYGPDTCCFVPHYINTVLLDSAKTRGQYPIGVFFFKDGKCDRKKPFIMKMRKRDGKLLSAYYATPEQAHKAWQLEKAKYIEETLERYSREPVGYRKEVADALMSRVEKLRYEADNDIETIKL